MCDYSLEQVASRPAAVADRLVSTSFSNTITRGFAAADDPNTAVCLRPGTEIAFDTPPRYQNPTTYREQLAPGTVARFREIDLHVPNTHHDALEFAEGTIVTVARLVEGQRATVLQLPASEHVAREAREEAAQEERQAQLELRV
jgi:hypothetical protein